MGRKFRQQLSVSGTDTSFAFADLVLLVNEATNRGVDDSSEVSLVVTPRDRPNVAGTATLTVTIEVER